MRLVEFVNVTDVNCESAQNLIATKIRMIEEFDVDHATFELPHLKVSELKE
jgi:hypothetical protein